LYQEISTRKKVVKAIQAHIKLLRNENRGSHARIFAIIEPFLKDISEVRCTKVNGEHIAQGWDTRTKEGPSWLKTNKDVKALLEFVDNTQAHLMSFQDFMKNGITRYVIGSALLYSMHREYINC
jgi:hypothetical protein